MATIYTATTASITSSASAQSFSHTLTDTKANKILFLVTGGFASANFSGATYNSTSFTSIFTTNNGNRRMFVGYILKANLPTSGTSYTVEITPGASTSSWGAAVFEVDDLEQTTPENTTSRVVTNGDITSNLALTNAATSFAFDAMYRFNGATATDGAAAGTDNTGNEHVSFDVKGDQTVWIEVSYAEAEDADFNWTLNGDNGAGIHTAQAFTVAPATAWNNPLSGPLG